MIFLDTSALVKRYVDEPGRAAVRRLMAVDGAWSASALARAETTIVLCRGTGGGSLPRMGALREDWDRFLVVPVDADCLADAVEIGCQYRVRMLDAIHLAAASRLPQPITFVSFDRQQAEAARNLGLELAVLESD